LQLNLIECKREREREKKKRIGCDRVEGESATDSRFTESASSNVQKSERGTRERERERDRRG
jgi:hypothetical protein